MRLRLTCFEEAMASRQQFDNTGSEALSGDNDASVTAPKPKWLVFS